MKRAALVILVAVLGISGGMLTRAALDAFRDEPGLAWRIEGLWKVAKAFTFNERLDRWQEELQRENLFYEFRDGKSCTQFRVTPRIACLRYDPYLLQGNVLMIFQAARTDAPLRYRIAERGTQLELVRELSRGTAWRPAAREVLIPISAQ